VISTTAGQPPDVYALDDSPRRTSLQERKELAQRMFWPFGNDLDCPIIPVAHIPEKAQTPGHLPCAPPKADPLHQAMNNGF
jgi:hypothetical protein